MWENYSTVRAEFILYYLKKIYKRCSLLTRPRVGIYTHINDGIHRSNKKCRKYIQNFYKPIFTYV
jgi:hypothetical protein